MPNNRSRFWTLALTAFVITFLWLPVLQLYGTALWQAATLQPAHLIEVLPLNSLSRFLFLNTLALGTLTAVFAIAFGLPMAISLARGPRWWRSIGVLLCAMPLAIPPILSASAWLEFTDSPAAIAQASLAADQPSSAPPVLRAAFVLALCYFPLVAFPLYSALRAVPDEVEDAARLFGNGWMTLRRVLWPMLSPAVYGAAGLVFALAMWEMGAPDLLDARIYSVQIYRDFNAQYDVGKAALDAVPMLLLGCLALWPAARALRLYGMSWQGAGAASQEVRLEGNIATALAVLLCAVSPVALLLVFVWHLRPPRVLLEMWEYNQEQIINTALLATAGALCITCISFALVVAWREWMPGPRRIALALAVTPLLFAPILLAIALINFWNQDLFAAIYGGRYSMMLVGYSARFLPLAILLTHEAARRVDETLLEAARNLGSTSRHAARAVLMPLLAPALIGVFALVWALCASELSTSVIINAPGGQTLPVPIFNQMHVGSTENVAALSLILVAMSSGILLVAALALRRLLRA
ncbi:MAG TPA: ABC transporter permease subunit [Abditibacteriaceae bacterium]|nr:ABC transporter permease subunit [Abditibacteriaceae bacterium]